MWWMYVLIVLLFVLAIYGLLSLMGFETRLLTRRTTRRAEDLYRQHDDQPRRLRRDR